MNLLRLRHIVLATALTAIASVTVAQTQPDQGSAPGDPPAHGQRADQWRKGQHQEGWLAVRAAIHDLRAIRRVYLETGRASQLPAVYQDVLAKTQNPMLRNYAYQQLARSELRPADPDKAIATLRTSLNENITRINTPASSKQ